MRIIFFCCTNLFQAFVSFRRIGIILAHPIVAPLSNHVRAVLRAFPAIPRPMTVLTSSFKSFITVNLHLNLRNADQATYVCPLRLSCLLSCVLGAMLTLSGTILQHSSAGQNEPQKTSVSSATSNEKTQS